MRRRITILTAVGLCLVLAFGAALAAERGRDASADRSKRGTTDAGNTGVEYAATDLFGDRVLQFRTENQTGANKARALLTSSYKQDGNAAVGTLNQILDMDLPQNPETDKLLASVYTALADHHEYSPAKEARYLGFALANTSDSTQRQLLGARIEELGGDPVAFALNDSSAQMALKTVGVADTCDAPDVQVITMTAVGDYYTDNLSVYPYDRDWYQIDVISADPAVGLILHVETCTDTPGTLLDDTDIYLFADCPPTVQLAFGGDGGCNDYFMSEFTSPCLGAGTYYLDVEGWLYTYGTADNIDLNVEAVATCAVPLPDDFEPDNDRANATPIGHDKPYDKPNAMVTGHIAKDIQAHNIFPPGDEDWMSFSLKETAMVTMQTANCFPTIFNDFDPACNPTFGQPDTKIDLYIHYEQGYGGLCNQQTAPGSLTIIGPPCMNDMDCDLDGDGLVYPDDDDLIYPVPGFPPCLPWSLFGYPDREEDSPFATDDDGGNSLASKLELCLPRTNNHSPSATVQGFEPGFNWYVRVYPYSASATFDYEVLVHTGEKCHFECEPNDGFFYGAGAHCAKDNTDNHIVIGEDIHGIYDYFLTFPNPDEDYFTFDVDEEALVHFVTDGYDSLACDTYIEVFVGPDPEGFFYYTGVWSEDQGPGWLSEFEVIMPPACELLGVPCAPGGNSKSPVFNTNTGPSYWMVVTSNYFNPNFPWTLHSDVTELGLIEADDFGDCGSGTEALAEIGQTWQAAIGASCDYDGYKFTLVDNTAIEFVTSGIDTAIRLVDCDTYTEIACDDDGGPGLNSMVSGCLAGGADYCLEVRAYGSGAGGYGLTLGGTAGCLPGVITGDGLYSCLDWDGCP